MAFYKDKLLKMIELVKSVLKEAIVDWNKRFIEEKEMFELIEEISLIHTKVLLYCALGENIFNIELPYLEKGVSKNLNL